MKIRLLAKTEVPENQPELSWPLFDERGELITDADYLTEFAGRSCYQSWNRPNPATASNSDYIKHIIDSAHFSVLEHGSATFYIEGVSRSLTHELVRHRHFSYSQLSQRFVNESTVDFIIPPAIRNAEGADPNAFNEFRELILETYQDLAADLIANGLSRKQAREAARAVLPNMTETKIVVTGNHRAWREFLQKRNSPGADAEIQELAQLLLIELKKIAPNTYQDM
jgi:thymidylate synthase (FAD)